MKSTVKNLAGEREQRLKEILDLVKTRGRELKEERRKLDIRKAELDAAEEAVKREKATLNQKLAESQTKATQAIEIAAQANERVSRISADLEVAMKELEQVRSDRTRLENWIQKITDELAEQLI
jgi:hypothetical protein